MRSLLTMDEASEQLGKTRRCLELWRKAGCPGFDKSGDFVQVDLAAVLGWAKKTRRKLGKKSRLTRAPARPRPPARGCETDQASLAVHISGDLPYEPADVAELDAAHQIHFRLTERVLWFFLESVLEQLPKELSEENLKKGARKALNCFYDDFVERENFEISGIGPMIDALDQVTINIDGELTT